MKKSIYLICFVIVIILTIVSCNASNKTQHPQFSSGSEAAFNYLKDKGYSIISNDNVGSEYVLSKEYLLELPYQHYWGLQSKNPEDYLNKTIETYSFIVKNHPLDNYKDNKEKQTSVWVMVCGNEVIGGLSLPVTEEPLYGGPYSLEGKTLEEITGLSYQEWQKQWNEKYR